MEKFSMSVAPMSRWTIGAYLLAISQKKKNDGNRSWAVMG